MSCVEKTINKYRAAMISLREKSTNDPVVCLKCAGWSSFGSLCSPWHIAQYGDICCCTETWTLLNKLLDARQKTSN